ncbi:exocyst complex component 3 isoform X2 [Lepisosteus oculatus]
MGLGSLSGRGKKRCALREQVKMFVKRVRGKRDPSGREETDPLLPLGESTAQRPSDVEAQVQACLWDGRLVEACVCIQEAERAGHAPATQLYGAVSCQVLGILAEALSGNPACLERMPAAVEAILWGQKCCLDQQGKGPSYTPVNWRQQFHQLVEKSVSRNIPQLPSPDSGRTLQAYLREVQVTVLSELLQLAPCLKPARLLGCIVKSYNKHIFQQLQQALGRSLQVSEIFLLLEWVARVYHSENFMGHPDIQDHSIKETDVLLVTDWIQKAEKKLLHAVQEEVSKRLDMILQNERETPDAYPYESDEDYIKLQVDVIQVLNSVITEAGNISHVLKPKVQQVCTEELLVFLQKYQAGENKFLRSKKAKNSLSAKLHPLKIVNRCISLREYLQKITGDKSDVNYLKGLSSLEDTESQARGLILHELIISSKALLRAYIRKGEKSMEDLIDNTKEYFTILPMKKQAAHKVLLESSYCRICFLYLKTLLKTDHTRLLEKWGDVEGRMEQDAGILHAAFSQLSPDVKQWSVVLLRVAEMLRVSDEDALKQLGSFLLRDIPEVRPADRVTVQEQGRGSLLAVNASGFTSRLYESHMSVYAAVGMQHYSCAQNCVPQFRFDCFLCFSKRQLRSLLQWKGSLSARQVTAVLGACEEVRVWLRQTSDPQDPQDPLDPKPLRWGCCFSCLW